MSFNPDLDRLTRGKVLVVGDVMLDSYWHGPTSRISPEAPVPVVRIDHEDMRLGGAANVSRNVTALGARSGLIAPVGRDATADRMGELLRAAGIDNHLVALDGYKTTTKLRIISRNQQLIRIDFEVPLAAEEATSIGTRFADQVERHDVVVLSDYAKGALASSPELIATARRHGRPVVIDPKGSDFTKYRGATVLTPNLSEFEAIVGHCTSEEEIVVKGSRLRESLGLAALLVTRSERGMTLLTAHGTPVHMPTRAREVFDVTGAGDTVVATLAAALACNCTMLDAVHLANTAAGIVVGKFGTATASAAELHDALRAEQPLPNLPPRGAIARNDLGGLLALLRGHGERVVMTNGCFDILHPGHVAYLEEAKALGHRLIVAVNADESVRRLKGPSRPINTLTSRMKMLAALACVDWVVAFSEDTPAQLYQEATPDVLVKGGDYTPEQVAGADTVLARGGEVRILKFLDGHSTSGIVTKILQG